MNVNGENDEFEEGEEKRSDYIGKGMLYSKYYPDFKMLKQSIFGLLQTANQLDKKELASLLTLPFKLSKGRIHFRNLWPRKVYAAD